MKFAAALIATVAANRYESMNEDDLLVNLESTLSSALSSEARGDADAAVAKTLHTTYDLYSIANNH